MLLYILLPTPAEADAWDRVISDICDFLGVYVSMYLSAVVCKLLDLGHAVLVHAELGQRFWDMRNWDSNSGTCGTGTAVLGHAELGQRFWDSFYSVKMGKIVVSV